LVVTLFCFFLDGAVVVVNASPGRCVPFKW